MTPPVFLRRILADGRGAARIDPGRGFRPQRVGGAGTHPFLSCCLRLHKLRGHRFAINFEDTGLPIAVVIVTANAPLPAGCLNTGSADRALGRVLQCAPIARRGIVNQSRLSLTRGLSPKDIGASDDPDAVSELQRDERNDAIQQNRPTALKCGDAGNDRDGDNQNQDEGHQPNRCAANRTK